MPWSAVQPRLAPSARVEPTPRATAPLGRALAIAAVALACGWLGATLLPDLLLHLGG